MKLEQTTGARLSYVDVNYCYQLYSKEEEESNETTVDDKDDKVSLEWLILSNGFKFFNAEHYDFSIYEDVVFFAHVIDTETEKENAEKLISFYKDPPIPIEGIEYSDNRKSAALLQINCLENSLRLVCQNRPNFTTEINLKRFAEQNNFTDMSVFKEDIAQRMVLCLDSFNLVEGLYYQNALDNLKQFLNNPVNSINIIGDADLGKIAKGYKNINLAHFSSFT